ncbi:MAG: hypothetical protein RLN62_05850 [Rickettsiales bacterium]
MKSYIAEKLFQSRVFIMIISRTPFRISFFGGGTDYPEWYQEHGGNILSTTISHYVYTTCRYLPPFFKHKNRFVWRVIEEISDHQKSENPIIRSAIEYLSINFGVEIHYHGDLPSRSGIGSSSSFAVGLLNALHAMNESYTSKLELACEAIHLERNILKETVGVQDQIAASYGGLNNIKIKQNSDFEVNPVILPQETKSNLEKHFLLFFTGISRYSSEVATHKVNNFKSKIRNLQKIHQMTDEAIKILTSNNANLNDFGRLLDEAWSMKKDISAKISSNVIDDIYTKAKSAGAIGGKLLGAGGGGFMLLFAPPERHAFIKESLNDLLHIPFSFENEGSKIIYYDQKYNKYIKNTFHSSSNKNLKTCKKKQSIESVS